MGRFSGGDGGLAGFHTLNEITMMICRAREFHFANVLRQLLVIAPFLVGCLEGAAIYVDPTVGADPFGPAPNLGITSGDGHIDVVGVFQLDPIFGAGVPGGIRRRELAMTFYY